MATAGWGDVDAGNSGTAPKDICPKGWRLPTDTELVTLSNSYSSPADFIANAESSKLVDGKIIRCIAE